MIKKRLNKLVRSNIRALQPFSRQRENDLKNKIIDTKNTEEDDKRV